ncbi:MAG TPA: bifunctional serine/threonine-protein kinase/formylglycine-generating enzyme family protein [Planctomycetota bacterium]|nr:bifunctional serine/threonine-protein kinase/formylglycine-generating enzyme family protein [Planctomycetota bacterium]
MKSNSYEVRLVGEVVDGRYRVERLLGHGGMGTVWLAIDVRVDGRRVVVKVPRASFLEQEGFLERFEREIQSLTRLDHPRIVKVLDVAHLKEVPVVVLQYLAGGSLAERTERPITADLVIPWITPIAEGLDFIHSQGVIHRDVKPGNILFDGYGNAFLADFGIAKALGGEETGLTSTGASPGSPSYMAPEAGSPDALGPNYDQYSLACVVYKALSGRLPHEGRTALEVILKRTVDPPVPLRQAAPQVSAPVEAVVMRALARRPGDRFPSCRAFAAAFGGAVTGVAPVNPPTDFTRAETRVVSQTTAEPPRGDAAAPPTPVSAPAAAPTPVPTPLPAGRSKSRGIAVAIGLAVAALGGVFAWNRFHAPRTDAGPVADAEQSFTFDPGFLAEGGATDRSELVVFGTVSPPSTPEVDVGLLGDLRNPVAVGERGVVEATLTLPKEEGPAVVVVWTALRRELARRSIEIDRTPPRVTARPKETRARSSDEKSFVVALDASEPVELFEAASRRALASAPAGASEVALELPGGATADPAPRTLHVIARDRCAHESRFDVSVEVYDLPARVRRFGERRPSPAANLEALHGAELGAACETFESAATAWERDVRADALLGARGQELLAAADWKSARERVRSAADASKQIPVAIPAPAPAPEPSPAPADAAVGSDENAKRIAGWADVVRRAPTEQEVPDADVRARLVDAALPWLVRDRQTGIELVLVPRGPFEMGSTDRKLPKDESPAHAVEITNAFYVGRFEVTQEQWKRVTGANPSGFQDDPRLPVENVTWEDVRDGFLAKTELRLLTEAEWEYVARGPVKRAYPWGDAITAELANCRSRSPDAADGRTRTAGSCPKGASWCGALDLSGNVWEWCSDWYDAYPNRPKGSRDLDPTGPKLRPASKERVVRGGSWYYFDDDARCARRMHFKPDEKRNDVGFRVARTP